MSNLIVINSDLLAKIEELAEKDPVLKGLITKSNEECVCTRAVNTSRFSALKQACISELEDLFVIVDSWEGIEDSISQVIAKHMYYMNNDLAEMILDSDFSGLNEVGYELMADDLYDNIRSYADEQLRDELHDEVKELFETWLDEQE